MSSKALSALAALAWALSTIATAHRLAQLRRACWRTDHDGHRDVIDEPDGISHTCGRCGLAWSETD